MPRPRKASDAEVMEATRRVMLAVPPGEVTLGRIAAEAGVTPAALVQRFGSKRGLMLAVMAEFSGSAPAQFREMRSAHPSPLAALRAYAAAHARMANSPRMLAHHLAYLQLDLTDPEFHAHLSAHARDAREGLRQWIADAVAAGELVARLDVEVLTRAVQAALNGSLFVWATLREGSAEEWVRGDVDAVLAPYLAGG